MSVPEYAAVLVSEIHSDKLYCIKAAPVLQSMNENYAGGTSLK